MTDVEIIDEDKLFGDPEGFVDDISDEDLVPEVLRQKPSLEEFEDNCVVVTGIPVVGSEKFAKVKAVMTKIVEKIDSKAKIFVPSSPDGGSLGVMFSEWPNKTIAEFAVTALDNYALDKNHTFSAKLFSQIKNMKPPSEDWTPPTEQPYNDVGDLWWWLQNDRSRDQFAVLYEKLGVPTVGVYWHHKGQEPELGGDPAEFEREGWTDSVFAWSPHGSYISTIHRQGVAVWGGPHFTRCQRFSHPDVLCLDFSPCENFLVTYAPPTDNEQWWDTEGQAVRIFNVVTGELMKTFSAFELTGRQKLPSWPFFKWSHDGKYFACLKAPEKDKLEREKKVDGISVFESEKFELLGRRNIAVENIIDFEWSPAQNVIAYYSECTETTPAEFGLVQIPSHSKLRSAKIYNVAEARMFWQKSGKRLAVYTMRYNKKQLRDNGEVKYVGGCTYHVGIFEIDKKDVSLMNLTLPEPFLNLGWDPLGDKFCLLTGNQMKATPHVYNIEPNSDAPKLVSKLDAGPQYNEVLFAPQGGWLAVMAKKSSGGNVMFVDTTLAEAKRTNVVEHPGFNAGYWDPTGRYFVTCTTTGARQGTDMGYRIYTFQGRELYRKNLDSLTQFRWRPRPPVKLDEKTMKEIKKNLKKISTKFVKQDEDEKCKASQEVIEKRRKIMSAFELVRKRNLEAIISDKPTKIALRNGIDTDAEMNPEDFVEEEITIALSTTKTLAPLTEGEEAED